MTDAAAATAPGARRIPRAFYRNLGNVLLGVAFGLVCYYVVTDVVAGLEQRSLRTDLHELGVVGAAGPAATIPVEEGPVLDFTDWASQDEAYWKSLPVGGAFGRIVAPRMRLDVAMVKGATSRTLQRGPGWVTTTDLPGPGGNCGISGHRTTYGAPFKAIDRLRVGDTIDLYSPFRRYRYRVTELLTVRPTQVQVFDSTVRPTLTLTACHPPYSARYRYVVHAELVEVSRLAQAAD